MKKKVRLSDKVRIILNPVAGSGMWRKFLSKIRRGLRREGFSVELIKTEAPGDAQRAVEEVVADGRYYSIIPFGGDGTIHEVINGLEGRKIPLALFPGGTGNVLCKEFSIPSDPEGFLATVCYGKVRSIDVGLLNGRRFHSFVGAGFDGHIVRYISQSRRGNMRQWHYIWPTVRAAASYRPTRICVKVDGRLVVEDASTVVVGNVRSYGGPFEITHRAVSDDGLLDICCVRGRSFLSWVKYTWGMFCRNIDRYRDVEYFQGREIEIWSDEHTPVQVDGEVGGELPVSISVQPRQVPLLVPA